MGRLPTTDRPYLTTGQCARLLGVPISYIRAEVEEGLLKAYVVPAEPGKRMVRRIRIYHDQFRDYCAKYFPSALSRVPPAA